MNSALARHLEALRACRACPEMQPPSVAGRAVYSKVILVGQAPGVKEPIMQKPFAWTAGSRTSWLQINTSAPDSLKKSAEATHLQADFKTPE